MPDLRREDFIFDEFFWKTTVMLPTWRGFQSRRGPYGAKNGESTSDGTVDVVFAPEGRDEAPLRDSEIEFVRWAVEHESQMQRALLDALLECYPTMQGQYDEFVDPGDMPDVECPGDFRNLIGLHTINVHPIQKDGAPYVGFELGCTWDDEHGLGVLMHGTRVVEIGGADTAILLWIAERDAGVVS